MGQAGGAASLCWVPALPDSYARPVAMVGWQAGSVRSRTAAGHSLHSGGVSRRQQGSGRLLELGAPPWCLPLPGMHLQGGNTSSTGVPSVSSHPAQGCTLGQGVHRLRLPVSTQHAVNVDEGTPMYACQNFLVQNWWCVGPCRLQALLHSSQDLCDYILVLTLSASCRAMDASRMSQSL